jgi:hypothetical protein
MGFLERADLCAPSESTEHNSSMGVGDDVAVKMASNAGDEAIVGKAPKKLPVVWGGTHLWLFLFLCQVMHAIVTWLR